MGLGAARADSCYGLITALGLSTISRFLLQKAIIIKMIGGLGLFAVLSALKAIEASI